MAPNQKLTNKFLYDCSQAPAEARKLVSGPNVNVHHCLRSVAPVLPTGLISSVGATCPIIAANELAFLQVG